MRQISDHITTARLVLRPFRLADADALFEFASDPDYARFQSGPDEFANRAANDRFLAELMLREPDLRPVWAITIEDWAVGIVSLTFESGHRIAVLGYGLRKDLWGEGMAMEAVSAIIDAAFAGYENLHRMRASTDVRNMRSTQLLTKLGFTHEGTLRADVVGRGGELVDVTIYGLLRKEWFGTRRGGKSAT
jgi:[ribosomal protein S5]-alanine N-acetyltransferase